jgi:DNA-binding NarL/FixJ family response regulator
VANPTKPITGVENPSAKRAVLLVEDHPITRLGLKAVINQQPDLSVSAETDNAASALELVLGKRPDIAVIDISLKTANGIELMKNIAAAAPGLPVLIVSMHDEKIYAERALRAGARGYLMKQEASEKIILAIRSVLKGEIFVSEKTRDNLLHRFTKSKTDDAVFPIDTLSDREMEVFQLIGQGFSTRQIAEQLKLSTKTIDSYREHLKTKLNLSSGSDLVRYAIEWAKGA